MLMNNSVCRCAGTVRVFTLTNFGCEVLQEGVFQQLGKVIQDKGKAWFGVIFTHHVFNLLLVGLTL